MSSGESKDFKYYAFISYSHQDKKWGDWLHKALETYRVPKHLVGQASRDEQTVPARIMPVFRDREELPTATDLGRIINQAFCNHFVYEPQLSGIKDFQLRLNA